MADVDLEIDTGAHFKVDTQHDDDDLINYESDAADAPHGHNDANFCNDNTIANKDDDDDTRPQEVQAGADTSGEALVDTDASLEQIVQGADVLDHDNSNAEESYEIVESANAADDGDQDIDYDFETTLVEQTEEPNDGEGNMGLETSGDAADIDDEPQHEEITWEQEDVTFTDDARGATSFEHGSINTATLTDDLGEAPEQPQFVEGDGLDDGFQDSTEEGLPGQDLDHETHDNSDSENEAYPNITVQYKGDTFPCFSHGSEGFFTDVKVLDSTMDVVLAGFRAELHTELSADEDLVFQIDEVGLEFTESSNSDCLTHLTLRQIMDIHDLLAKNQDPDSTRSLYTYLFCRPNPTRRYDLLVECATSGKKLDDVAYLFDSHDVHNDRQEDDGSQDQTIGGQMDDYESVEGGVSEEIDDSNVLQQEAENGDDEQLDVDTSGENTADADANDEEDSHEHAEHEHAEHEHVEHEHVEHDGEWDAAGAEKEDGVDEIKAPLDEVEADASSTQEVETTENIDEAEGEGEGEAAEFAQDLLLADNEADAVNIADDEIDFGGDEQYEDIANGVDTSPKAQNGTETNQDDEIDWRDAEGEGAEEGDVSSTTGKRSREDDDVGAEDEQDSKRVRS